MLWALMCFFIACVAFFLISTSEENKKKPSQTSHIASDFNEDIEDTIEQLQVIQTTPIGASEMQKILSELKDLRKTTTINRRLVSQAIRDALFAYKQKKNSISPKINGAGTLGIIANVYRAVDLSNLGDFEQKEIEPLRLAKNKADDLILEIDLTILTLERFLKIRSQEILQTRTRDCSLINIGKEMPDLENRIPDFRT